MTWFGNQLQHHEIDFGGSLASFCIGGSYSIVDDAIQSMKSTTLSPADLDRMLLSVDNCSCLSVFLGYIHWKLVPSDFHFEWVHKGDRLLKADYPVSSDGLVYKRVGLQKSSPAITLDVADLTMVSCSLFCVDKYLVWDGALDRNSSGTDIDFSPSKQTEDLQEITVLDQQKTTSIAGGRMQLMEMIDEMGAMMIDIMTWLSYQIHVCDDMADQMMNTLMCASTDWSNQMMSISLAPCSRPNRCGGKLSRPS